MDRSRVTPLAAGVFFAVAFATRAAHADTPPSPDRKEAAAEARFRDGSDAFDKGHVDEACTAFGQSLRLYPTLGSLLNLALCYEKQGKTASAWAAFTHAAAWANDPGQRDRREFAHRHASALERLLSRVQIDVDADAAPVAVAVDGEPIGEARSTLPVFLDPGDHVVEATAPSRVRYVTKVTVPATPSAAALLVKIPALAAEPTEVVAPQPQTPAPVAHSVRRTAGWIVGASGIVAVGVGSYFGIDAISKTGEIAASCGAHCDTGSTQLAEVASLVAFGVGLAALATGGWLLFVAPPSGAPNSARIEVAPRVWAHGGGLGLEGSW
jgi:hypothetical protein